MSCVRVLTVQELSAWKGSRRLDRMLLRYGILLLAVLAVVFVSFYGQDRLNEQIRGVDAHRLQVRSLLRWQVDEETGVRGYLETGSRTFLEPYERAHPQLERTLRELHASTPAQRPDGVALARFTLLHDAWEHNIAAPILRNPADRLSPLRQRLGKSLVDRMRADIGVADAWNARRADEYVARARSLEYATLTLIFLCVVAMATIGYLMELLSARREQALLLSVMEERDSAARIGEWRSKVVAMLAHDFKSTLGVIRAYNELLADFPERRSDPKPYAEIDRAVGQLSGMADEALLMARVSSGRLEVRGTPVDISELLGEIAERYRSVRPVYLSTAPLCVAGDREYLLRVFDNLVGNAIKYSPEGTPVSVRVEQRGGEVQIVVKDSGRGIDPEDLPHVFDEYYRSAAHPQVGGAGIGLFIVKKIVDAHRGSITIRSRVGRGTTVYVRIPAVAAVHLGKHAVS